MDPLTKDDVARLRCRTYADTMAGAPLIHQLLDTIDHLYAQNAATADRDRRVADEPSQDAVAVARRALAGTDFAAADIPWAAGIIQETINRAVNAATADRDRRVAELEAELLACQERGGAALRQLDTCRDDWHGAVEQRDEAVEQRDEALDRVAELEADVRVRDRELELAARRVAELEAEVVELNRCLASGVKCNDDMEAAMLAAQEESARLRAGLEEIRNLTQSQTAARIARETLKGA